MIINKIDIESQIIASNSHHLRSIGSFERVTHPHSHPTFSSWSPGARSNKREFRANPSLLKEESRSITTDVANKDRGRIKRGRVYQRDDRAGSEDPVTLVASTRADFAQARF